MAYFRPPRIGYLGVPGLPQPPRRETGCHRPGPEGPLPVDYATGGNRTAFRDNSTTGGNRTAFPRHRHGSFEPCAAFRLIAKLVPVPGLPMPWIPVSPTLPEISRAHSHPSPCGLNKSPGGGDTGFRNKEPAVRVAAGLHLAPTTCRGTTRTEAPDPDRGRTGGQ